MPSVNHDANQAGRWTCDCERAMWACFGWFLAFAGLAVVGQILAGGARDEAGYLQLGGVWMLLLATGAPGLVAMVYVFVKHYVSEHQAIQRQGR